MASLHATKKSNRASSMSKDIHARTSRKQVDDDLEDTGASDAMDAAEDGSDQEQAQSQSKSARELLSNMVAGARKRHTAKKKNVIASHACTAKNVKTSIDNLFDEHETKSLSAHEAQLKRLQQLLKHKAKLEAQMEAKLVALRGSYDAHSRDLENVLNARIKELK